MQTINIGTSINIDDLLTSRLLIQANSGGGKSVLARVIMEEVYGKVPFIVMDIEGEYYTLKERFGDILVIGGQHADVPINIKSAKLLPREIIANRLNVVIDLSDMQMNDRILYAKYFLETMMDLQKEYWVNYFVFLEEAHKLCGEQDKQASATAVKDLMSRGRKRGYCGVLLTQRISKLHKDAAAECNNKFIGRTFLDIDLDRAAKELGLSSATDKNIIRNLTPGQFYAFGTSIEPHQVHTVKVNLPKTKIPKAGVNIDIKPQKPTAKVLQLLTKLNDLPAEAEKELKTMQQLQSEVNRLTLELRKKVSAPAPQASQNNEKYLLEIDCLKKERDHAMKLLAGTEKTVKDYSIIFAKIKKGHEDLSKLLVVPDHVQNLANVKMVSIKPLPAGSSTKERISYSAPVAAGDTKLGKCSLALLQFLATYMTRSFSYAQLAIATGYSSGSGGFNNSLSELNTKGLISRNNGRVMVNRVPNLSDYTGEIPHKDYNIETYINNLGKCEAEIYRVLLDNPTDEFTKDQLSQKTATPYSPNSGGFNNSISRLNTLELIKRSNGMIRLNPELLEI